MAATKILVVDDDLNIQRVLVFTLKQEGFEVHVASDGQAGVEMAAAIAPDLILMDVAMPKLDGYAATQQIRAAESGRKVPIIMLTAEADVEQRVRGLRAGADDDIVKPFHPLELLADEAFVRLAHRVLAAHEARHLGPVDLITDRKKGRIYTVGRREQGGSGWSTDYPDADVNFSIRFSELTKAIVGKQPTEEPRALVATRQIAEELERTVGERQRAFLARASCCSARFTAPSSRCRARPRPRCASCRRRTVRNDARPRVPGRASRWPSASPRARPSSRGSGGGRGRSCWAAGSDA